MPPAMLEAELLAIVLSLIHVVAKVLLMRPAPVGAELSAIVLPLIDVIESVSRPPP